MYIIRDIFQCKPGKPIDLVAKFIQAAEVMKGNGIHFRVMKDTVATYWTVVVEFETEELSTYLGMYHHRNLEMKSTMKVIWTLSQDDTGRSL